MTIEELLGLPSKDIDAIPRAELEAFFNQFLNATRPERVQGNSGELFNHKTVARPSRELSEEAKIKQMKIEKARALARSMGVNI